MESKMIVEQSKRKRPYLRPRLRIIDLVPEQTLGVGCKSYEGLGAPGPTNALCGGPVTPCRESGS